jgi:hypothetical protein
LTVMVVSSWKLDAACCALFAVAALALLAEDQRNLIGYACVLLCAVWGIGTLITLKPRLLPPKSSWSCPPRKSARVELARLL